MNAARALLLPRERAGKRTPLWLSRLRAKDLLQAIQGFGDFPILLETFRDCLRDVLDLGGLADVLDRIQSGDVDVVVHDADVPSPVALGLDYRFAMQFVYEYDAPRGERQLATTSRRDDSSPGARSSGSTGATSSKSTGAVSAFFERRSARSPSAPTPTSFKYGRVFVATIRPGKRERG